MTEAIYKVGDVLEFKSSQYFPDRMDSIPGPIRTLIIRVDDPGYEYVSYRLLMFSKECNNFINRHMSALQKDIITSAKRIGHIDISLLRFEEQEEPDYAMFFTAATLAQAADLKNENEKLKSQIACMEGRIESLIQKRNQLDADNRYLSAKVEHLTINNDKKNGKIGSLQANLAEETLKRKQAEAELEEKTEVLDGIYHSDIVCENNKLRNENRILNEIVNGFKSTCANCEARSENERLRADNEKLRAANASFSQKIKCAERYFDSAASALYEGREHFSIALHSIDNK